MLAYLRETEGTLRSPERQRYSLKQLYPFFTGKDVFTLSAQDIRSYIAGRQEQGVQPATINRELTVLSSALNYALKEWGWALSNPVEGRKLSEPEGRVRWISKDEAKALIRVAEGERQAPHLADFIRLALHTGMRCGEILGLEWPRVDLDERLVYLEGMHTKAGKRRSIPLNQEAYAALRNRLQFYTAYRLRTQWVFCRADGTRIQSVKRSFATACRKAGIKDFRIHDLRHSCAAWLVTAGVPRPEVRDLLGHSTVQMTERYAHLAPENIRAAVARLAES